MHVVSRYTAAEAAATIDPRGRAIALSMVIAAGALLLIMPPVIGVTGTLSLLTALIAAFSVGWGFTRGQSWLYRSPLAATRWAFLLSAAGWLLALVAWYGGQDWPAMLPGVACGGAGAAVRDARPGGQLQHGRPAPAAAPAAEGDGGAPARLHGADEAGRRKRNV